MVSHDKSKKNDFVFDATYQVESVSKCRQEAIPHGPDGKFLAKTWVFTKL